MIFSNFSQLRKFSGFQPTNLTITVEKTFLREYYHSIRILQKILPHLTILKKFNVFLKKETSFLEKPNFLLIQSHSTANALQFGEKKLSSSET